MPGMRDMTARGFVTTVALGVLVVLMPAMAFGQASLTGIVRDASGAVLPGVTVEAASPALIEKVRTTVTNDTGQYRIENLTPGTYSVSFTLAGFSTVKREGIELQGSFSATINADMRVGAVEETITVTGESPIVDVQNTTQQRVLSHDVIDIIPTGRSDKTLATLIPGVSIGGAISQDVGGTQDQVSSQLTVHGSRGVDQRLTQNGVSLGITANGANTLIVATNLSAYQEVAIDTGAVSAELSTGGVRVTHSCRPATSCSPRQRVCVSRTSPRNSGAPMTSAATVRRRSKSVSTSTSRVSDPAMPSSDPCSTQSTASAMRQRATGPTGTATTSPTAI